MLIRRIVFFATALATAAVILALCVACLAPGGWTLPKMLILLCFGIISPWLGICVGNAMPGFLILMRAHHPPRYVLPLPVGFDTNQITLRTALLVTIRNEDMTQVLPGLNRLVDALAPHGDRFAAWILSDTQDPALAALEEHLIGQGGQSGGLRYRRRQANTGFKAGNVMDFLDHHAGGCDLAITLDADSEMSAGAVLTLVRIMQANPTMGIVQHLTVGKPASAAFPRLFQFGMRAGMRVWATGQGWWQGDDGPYWGHNAILRIAPFRAHARLEPLPNGAAILSHDQVEAARMRGAGWRVCVWAEEDGSLEANPPALPEYLHRDSRWLAGNLQYIHLLRLPGFRAMGRWQLVQAILLFAGAPFYTMVLIFGAFAAGDLAQAPAGPVAALIILWLLTLYSPKLCGYAQVLLSPALAARYGGRAQFAKGAAAELLFSVLMDAIAQPTKTLAMLRLALGAKPGWLPQNRIDRGVTWAEATRLFWPHTLFGLLTAIPMGPASLPWTAGLLLAIPFCVWTSDPALSDWLSRRRIAATPEELPPLPG